MPDSSNTSSGLQKTIFHYSGKGIPFDIHAKSLCMPESATLLVANATFKCFNSRSITVSTGIVTSSPAISRTNFTLPADDNYQAIVASTRKDEIQRYTLSINLDQIPVSR